MSHTPWCRVADFFVRPVVFVQVFNSYRVKKGVLTPSGILVSLNTDDILLLPRGEVFGGNDKWVPLNRTAERWYWSREPSWLSSQQS